MGTFIFFFWYQIPDGKYLIWFSKYELFSVKFRFTVGARKTKWYNNSTTTLWQYGKYGKKFFLNNAITWMNVENNIYHDLTFENYRQVFWGPGNYYVENVPYPSSIKVERKTHREIWNRLQGIRMTYWSKIYCLSQRQKYQKEIEN